MRLPLILTLFIARTASQHPQYPQSQEQYPQYPQFPQHSQYHPSQFPQFQQPYPQHHQYPQSHHQYLQPQPPYPQPQPPYPQPQQPYPQSHHQYLQPQPQHYPHYQPQVNKKDKKRIQHQKSCAIGPVQRYWMNRFNGKKITYGNWGEAYLLNGLVLTSFSIYDERRKIMVDVLIRNLRLTEQFIGCGRELCGNITKYYILMKYMGVNVRSTDLDADKSTQVQLEANKKYKYKYGLYRSADSESALDYVYHRNSHGEWVADIVYWQNEQYTKVVELPPIVPEEFCQEPHLHFKHGKMMDG